MSLADANMHLVETHEDVEEFFRWLGERRPILGFDTETGGLEWWHMRLRTVQFGDAMRGWTIPWEWWAGVPREVFRTYQGPMVAHNATFDIRFLERHGLQLPRFIDDTYTMAHVLDPNRPLGLKELSKKHIDPMADAGQKALREGMKKNGWTWDTVPVDFLPYWVYSALDPIETARLWELFSPQIDAAGPAIRELYEREIVVDRMMSDASVPGVRIDEEYARQERARLWDDVVRLRAEVEEEWGMSPSADVKVAERLVADGMPLTDRTATGRVKLDAAALEGLEGKHPLADQVLQFRRASKFVAAYFDGVLKRLDGDRVHCEIRTLGARTGRMSVAQPALQQIPSHDTSVRRMFIPGEGNVLMSIDFSNIEVRILAHLCRDETMMNAFLADADVHMEMARAMYGPDAGKAERKHSKSGCVPTDYEILTQRGWLAPGEVRVGDLTPGLNVSTGKAEWTTVREVVVYPNTEVVALEHARRQLAVCTPDHRWAVRRRRTPDPLRVEHLHTIPRDTSLVLAAPGLPPLGDSPVTDAEAALLAWLHTDGHVAWSTCTSGRTSQAGGRKRGVKANVSQQRPRGVAHLRKLEAAGVLRYSHDTPTGCGVWSASPEHVRDLWVRSGLADGGGLEALVLRLPESGVVEFVEACEAADGWTDPQGATFCHRDDRDGDILRAYMLAAWRLGRWSRVRPHGESYRVTAKREGFTMQTARQVPAGSTDVWCVRTDSGTWTTRAPGVSGPMLTGNTLGKIYGIGTKKFAKQQGVTVEEAEKFMAFYDEKFPGVTDFVRAVEYTARHRLKEEGTAYVQVDGGRKHQLTYREAAEWEKFYTLVNYLCVTPDTRVLTADLRYVPAGSVRPGDALVGFDENPEGSKYRKFRTATVEAAPRTRKECVTVRTSTGQDVTCSTDHQWLTRRSRYLRWLPAAELLPGDELLSVGVWDTDTSYAAGWLAGMYDGEGCLHRRAGRGGCPLTFSQNPGPVLDVYKDRMQELGLPFRPHATTPGSTTPTTACVTSSLHSVMRVLGTLRPERFVPRFREVYEGVNVTAGATVGVTVLGVDPAGWQEVVALRTDTRTFVAEGLLTHNCQGTAAELLKEKIVALRDAGLAEYIRLPVHDEILFEVPVEKVYEVGSLALEVMEDRSLTKWAVPITCDLEIYDESWAQSVEGARSLSEYAPKE